MSILPATTSESKSVRIEKLAREARRALSALIDASVESPSFEDREKTALVVGNELQRQDLELNLQQAADGYAKDLRINFHHDKYGSRPMNDCLFKRHEPGEVRYFSLCGELKVRRFTYRRRDIRNSHTVVPLELEAGLMHGLTPALARGLALGYAKGPVRSYVEDLEAAFRQPPSRSTLERKAKLIGSWSKHYNLHIEPVVRAEERVPRKAKVIVLGLDRTSVPMEEDAPGKRRPRRKKPRVRKKPKPVEVNWRMDYIGTVSLLDQAGETLVTRRYRAPSEQLPHQIVGRMMEDLTLALSQRPTLKVAIVQDGATELWKNLRHWLRGNDRVTSWYEGLDWYHMDERLSLCLKLIESEPLAQQQMRKQWHTDLIRSNRAVDRIISHLRRRARRLCEDDREQLTRHINYFSKRKKLMCYARLRNHGIPIGSGITEGTCKSLIAARAKRSGQRWRPAGLGAALHLRAIQHSDRFDRFWLRFADRYRASRLEPM